MFKRKNTTAENSENMTFLEHLEALRGLLFKVLIAILIGGTIVFIFIEEVFDYLIFAPLDTNFFTYQYMCKLTHWLHYRVTDFVDPMVGCFEKVSLNVIAPQMTTQFMTAMLVAFIGGIVIMFPYIIYQFWLFIRPALYKKEQKNARGLVFFTTLLFLSGILFGYFLIAPLSINFLGNFKVSDSVQNLPSLTSYMGILVSTTLASGVVFELPILVYFLSKVGLITPEGMRKYRKHSFVGTLLLSAIITPPDVFSQILVSIPIVILYEISIYISKFVQKAKVDDDDY